MKQLFYKVAQYLKEKIRTLNIILFLIILLIIGYIWISGPTDDEKMIIEYKDQIQDTNSLKKTSDELIDEYLRKIEIEQNKIVGYNQKLDCYEGQVERILNQEVVERGYCDKNILEEITQTIIPSASAGHASIKKILNLDHCRTTQAEEEHAHDGNGSVYAMDIACVRGQTFDVYAPFWKDTYEVRAVSYDERLGNYVILKHGEYWFIFGHTETLLKKGDRVYPGDQIGLVDKSGMSENYHLHFELWKDGYNISYKHMFEEGVVYNTEHTYEIRKQRGWFLGEEEAMNFIADFEGFRNCAYEDRGQYSIGYGTVSFPGECISKDEAKKRKLNEISRLMENVYKNHFVDTHEKRVALVSATYNLGINSPITEVKKRRTNHGVCEYFGKFVKSQGEVLRGLEKRRDIECDLYNGNKELS